MATRTHSIELLLPRTKQEIVSQEYLEIFVVSNAKGSEVAQKLNTLEGCAAYSGSPFNDQTGLVKVYLKDRFYNVSELICDITSKLKEEFPGEVIVQGI